MARSRERRIAKQLSAQSAQRLGATAGLGSREAAVPGGLPRAARAQDGNRRGQDGGQQREPV
jgi:hypothetical protein